MKKRAFTLTELLVVVVIIGTLAAVVLPKFTKVLETRKTTEAEDIMQAIRTEQEARCTLDKKYATTFDELAAGPTSTSSNYTYALANAGVSAASNSKGYTLRILSYANGGICCEGDYCSKLNKSYPSCGAYVPNEADNACLPEGVEPEPEPEPEPCTLTPKTKTLTCQEAGHPAGYTGSVTQTVDEETCQYVTTSDTCAKCQPTQGTSYTTSCPPKEGYEKTGNVVYSWNPSTCSYYKVSDNCTYSKPPRWWDVKTVHECDMVGRNCSSCYASHSGTWICNDEAMKPLWEKWIQGNSPEGAETPLQRYAICPTGVGYRVKVPKDYDGPTQCITGSFTYEECKYCKGSIAVPTARFSYLLYSVVDHDPAYD